MKDETKRNGNERNGTMKDASGCEVSPVTEDGMSLKDLHKRLGEIIEQNEKRGWEIRNDLPIVVRVVGKPTPTGRNRASRYFPISNASSSMLSFGTAKGSCISLSSSESKEIAPKQKAKRTTVKQINTAMGLYPELRGFKVVNDAPSKSLEVLFKDAYRGSIYYEYGLSDLTAEEWVEKINSKVTNIKNR